MKIENQVIVRFNQPLQCLLSFSYSVGERNILQTVLFLFFSAFIFLMPSKVIIIIIQFMFLGINLFWVLLRAHFNSPNGSG